MHTQLYVVLYSCSLSVNNARGILMEIALTLYTALGSIDIVIITILKKKLIQLRKKENKAGECAHAHMHVCGE